MPNYKIIFDTCGPFRKDEVVDGTELGDIAYLLKVGAVEETEEEISIPSKKLVMDTATAVEEAVRPLKDEIAILNDTVADYEKAEKAKDDEIKALKKQVKDLSK